MDVEKKCFSEKLGNFIVLGESRAGKTQLSLKARDMLFAKSIQAASNASPTKGDKPKDKGDEGASSQ